MTNGQKSNINIFRGAERGALRKPCNYAWERLIKHVPCAQSIQRRILFMNKAELVAAMAAKTQLSKKDSEKALRAFTDIVAEQLKKGNKVQLVGFGTFEVVKRAAREGRNPQTGKPMKIAASKAPKFKAGRGLKDIVNKK